MSKMQLIYAAIIGLVTVGGALQQGRITDRWGDEVSTRLATFTSRFEGVPTQIGGWTSTDTTVDPAQFKASHCHGYVSRVYENAKGDKVNVFLVSGKALHVTQHSPDWCYVAAGYEMRRDPSVYGFEVEGVPRPEFLNADFQKVTSTATTKLRILWSYSEDGNWSASKLATYAFAGKPALYKVYLITDLVDAPLADDATVAFAKEFLPAINPILFPAEGAAAPAAAAPATADQAGL